MDLVLAASGLTAIATFALLMAIFDTWLRPAVSRVEAAKAVATPRHRYERLVVADRPWWERVVAPVAARLASRMPALASQVSESDIIRAGLDPATLTPAEVYAAKLVAGAAILGVGLAVTPVIPIALLLALPVAFVGYVFPTEYLAATGRRRKAQLLRELPDFLSLVRPLATNHGLEHAVADVADALHAASDGSNLLARQVRAAVAAYGIGTDFYAALADIAAAADLEELDELAAALSQARRTGKGVGDVLAEHVAALLRPEDAALSAPRAADPALGTRAADRARARPAADRRRFPTGVHRPAGRPAPGRLLAQRVAGAARA